MLPVYVLVVALAMLLLVVGMYRGGGTAAVKSQSPLLLMMGGGLLAFAIAFVLVRETGAMVVVGTVTAGIASVAAAMLAHASRDPGSEMAAWSAPLWVLASGFALLAILGAVSSAT